MMQLPHVKENIVGRQASSPVAGTLEIGAKEAHAMRPIWKAGTRWTSLSRFLDGLNIRINIAPMAESLFIGMTI
jgi:hypothetical protein